MFRPAAPADAEAIARHRYPESSDAAERSVYAAWVEGALRRGLYLGWLAEGGEGVVAGAGLTLLEWGPSRGDTQPWRARVVNVWTHPERRRRGLARELVTRCLETAREHGVSRVSLSTTEEARALYEALGFTASGAELVWTAAAASGAGAPTGRRSSL